MKNRIRILATSDVHGHITPYLYTDGSEYDGGFAKLSNLIQQLRDDNTLLIDNGDSIEGSALTRYHAAEHARMVSPVTAVMNAMGYDYINLGNHDFSLGQRALAIHLKALKAPCITSNITFHDAPLGPTYVIRDFDGVKVALIGVSITDTKHTEPASNIEGYSFLDTIETVQNAVDAVRHLENPAYVIVVYHGSFEINPKTGSRSGCMQGDNCAYAMLQQVRGIDVLIAGHSHQHLLGTYNNTVYAETEADGRELICIDLATDSHTIEPVIYRADGEADEAIMKLIAREEADCQAWLDEPLAKTNMDLRITNENEARLKGTPSITLFNQIAMEETGAMLAACSLFKGATGFGASITRRALFTNYPYINRLVVKKLSGVQLKEFLEEDASYWSANAAAQIVAGEDPAHPENYDLVSGIDYRINVANPIGERVEEILYQGTPITEDSTFTLCVNSYHAAGGGGFHVLKQCETLKTIDSSFTDLAEAWFKNHPVIAFDPEFNIHVVNE